MTNLFQTVCQMSLTGTYVILVVLLARMLLSRCPRRFSYWLWALVFLRLACPVFPEGGFSLIPPWAANLEDEAPVSEGVSGEEIVSESAAPPTQDESTSGKVTYPAEFEETITIPLPETGKAAGDTFAKPKRWLSAVWFAGVLIFALYHSASYIRIKRSLKGAVPAEKGVYELPGIHVSFVMGVFSPQIYLSSGMEPDARRVILLHEQVHLKRRDYLVKPLALAIACVHWFNPFVWLGFYLMNQDMEISCDEEVVSQLGESSKKVYSRALLDAASGMPQNQKPQKSVCALLSFGEDRVKKRIKNVLRYHKASRWLFVPAAVLLIFFSAGLLCNPRQTETSYSPEGDGKETEGAADILMEHTVKDHVYHRSTGTFSGETTKPYLCYEKDGLLHPYPAVEITREDVTSFQNGLAHVQAVEKAHPGARYQYLLRENGQLHINIAEETLQDFTFSYLTCKIEDKTLWADYEGNGCYKKDPRDDQEVTFAMQVMQDPFYQVDELFENDSYEIKNLFQGDWDANGKEDAAFVYELQEEAMLDSTARTIFYIYLNGEQAYELIINEYPVFSLDKVISGDVDADGWPELIYTVFTGGVGGTGSWGKGILKIKNGEVIPMEFPSNLEYDEDVGIQVEVRYGPNSKAGDDYYGVTCPLLGKTEYFKAQNARYDGGELLDPYSGKEALVGANSRGYCDFDIIYEEAEGREYLIGYEGIMGEGGVSHILGFVAFRMDWEGDGTPKLLDFSYSEGLPQD